MTDQELNRNQQQPQGVLQRNLKVLVYLGVAVLVIVAAIFSSSGKRAGGLPGKTPPQPLILDNTADNVQDLKNQLLAEQRKQAQFANRPDPDYAPGGRYFGCVPGQPCTPQMMQQNPQVQQLTPEEQQEQQLAARERQLAFDSRFASNIAYAYTRHEAGEQDSAAQQGQGPGLTNFIPPRQPGAAARQEKVSATEINIDAAIGQPYVLYEGTTIDTILMNRLDGDAAGPVKVLVSNPVYSHDHQHVLIPEGTVVLGEARKIGPNGFGQQRRMAVVFHRLIMPDGYSVDLDQFRGLDQIGEQGLKDKVNNHYLQIFGTSIALGVIAGAAEVEMGGGALTGRGSQLFTTGASASVSSSATTVLDRFIQIPPTITIREGHRVKVYFTQDMLLPAYSNHTIPQTF
jgi:type IV secretory pathway VirB10-like protein